MSQPRLLPLDDPRWHSLSHSFGDADNVPGLIRALGVGAESPESEAAWDVLWGEVHHQGDTNSACYAALPHIVRIALDCPTHCSWKLFGWPASIEVKRARNSGPPIPQDLIEAYRWAVDAIPEAVRRQAAYPWDHVFAQAAAAALVASRGQALLGDAILELGPSVTVDFFKWQFDEDV